jgi:hypothetical protein
MLKRTYQPCEVGNPWAAVVETSGTQRGCFCAESRDLGRGLGEC